MNIKQLLGLLNGVNDNILKANLTPAEFKVAMMIKKENQHSDLKRKIKTQTAS